jgi:hypothetical protein
MSSVYGEMEPSRQAPLPRTGQKERGHKNAETSKVRCFAWGLIAANDPAAFPDREYLVGLHLSEAFDLARGRPLHFHDIDGLDFAKTEVQAQITLRHDARAAADFVHLDMLPCHDARALTKAGVADQGGWSTSVGWFDYDKERRRSLYRPGQSLLDPRFQSSDESGVDKLLDPAKMKPFTSCRFKLVVQLKILVAMVA